MVKNEDAHEGLVTHGSLFGTLDHVTAFAAGSCASQTLELELGTNGGVQRAIVEIAMAIGAYYEGPLLASMLRTFDRSDSRYSGVDATIEEKIEAIKPEQAYPGSSRTWRSPRSPGRFRAGSSANSWKRKRPMTTGS